MKDRLQHLPPVQRLEAKGWRKILETGDTNPGPKRQEIVGLTYTRGKNEGKNVEVCVNEIGARQIYFTDPRVNSFFLDRPDLIASLGLNIATQTPEEFITEQRAQPETSGRKRKVISFSGFASDGFNYEAQGERIVDVFEYYKNKGVDLSLVIHGGTKNGIPGIANMVAYEYGVTRMGCMPLQGLRSLSKPPLDYLEVVGDYFGEEVKSVASPPDILLVFGGGKNTLGEIRAAVDAGKTVVLVRFAQDFENVYELTSKTDFSTPEYTGEGKGRIITVNGEVDGNLESVLDIL